MLEVRKVQLQLKGKQLYVQAWLCTILPIWNVLTRYSASQSFTTRSQWNKRWKLVAIYMIAASYTSNGLSD